MVATRSQDRDNHAQSAEESQTLAERDAPMSSPGKEKALKSVAGIATPSAGTKRRKLDSAPSKSDSATPKTFSAVVIPTTTPDTASDQEYNSSEGNASKLTRDASVDVSSQRSEEGPLVGGHASKSGADIKPTQMSRRSRPQTSKGHNESIANKQPSPIPTTKEPPSARSSAKQSRKRDARMEVTSLVDPSPLASSHSEFIPTKSQHKRFEGEEAVPAPPVFPDVPAEKPKMRDAIEESEAELSDEEAPDVVAQSTGLEKARSAAAEAAKAIEAQRAVEKQKRKERNEFLERQAKATKKEVEETKSMDVRPRTSTDDEKTDPESPFPRDRAAGFQWSSKDALPELLPDEILATEPMAQFPAPSPEPLVVRAPINKKQKFLEERSRPPKDVRRGNVRIRVLEEKQATLAPKVSKASQMIRESWLAGRPGAKGRVMIERKKMGGGFVRK
ncbi:MAG: hypothetical protein Q9188_005818 [Gyalolechia gomerana]